MYNVEKIRQLLTVKFMTQQDLAETAGVSAGTVSRLMLTGRAKYTTIDKVARALDVDPQELIKRA
ncbi:MAG: helix-turn-helix domain-containing protein [Saccharofermentanales bacterium]|jgi:DNA-binding Xre family transcriptional regulator|nr:helix-turn-helix transcriptional regulator [Bacillota bacterium]